MECSFALLHLDAQALTSPLMQRPRWLRGSRRPGLRQQRRASRHHQHGIRRHLRTLRPSRRLRAASCTRRSCQSTSPAAIICDTPFATVLRRDRLGRRLVNVPDVTGGAFALSGLVLALVDAPRQRVDDSDRFSVQPARRAPDLRSRHRVVGTWYETTTRGTGSGPAEPVARRRQAHLAAA